MAYRLLHKKSSVIENGKPKLPTVDQLEHGELAINFGKGGETISIKNSNNEIISFNVTEEKFTTLESYVENLEQQVDENEKVTSKALNVLNKSLSAETEERKNAFENLLTEVIGEIDGDGTVADAINNAITTAKSSNNTFTEKSDGHIIISSTTNNDGAFIYTLTENDIASEDKLNKLTEEFEVISSRVTTFLDSESGLTETIDSLKEIQNYFAEHGTETANMMSAITQNAEAIETLSSNTQTAINEINSAITQNAESIAVLSSNTQTAINEINSAITQNAESIAVLSSNTEAAINEISSAITQNAESIAVLSSTTETAINEINSAITQNVEAIAVLSSNTHTSINEINSAITQNAESIEGVSTQLNINVSDIQALSADVLTHTERFTTIESYVEELEQQVDENEEVTSKTFHKLNNNINNLSDLVRNNAALCKDVTYDELKSLKEEKQLKQGILYRITDYVTTTIQENTQSANHPFDIIVEALTPNTLSEDAKACLHEGDEYFKNCNLSAWEIKYCFDNDTSRFAWADETNGKGVIYYMKDEFNNATWYDFKNIQFKRDNNWLNNHKSNFKALSASTEENIYFFTFSDVSGTASITVKDDSLNKNISSTSFYPCRNNNIGAYTKDNNDGYLKYNLNNTIFIGNGAESNHIGEHNCNNTFIGIYDNYIDMNCQNNVVSSNFSYNHIGIGFNGNIINAQFNYNKIGNLFKSNQLGSFLYCNIKDNFVENNSYGSTIKYCDFGNYIQRCSDLPTMANVIFDDEVIKYPTNTYGKGLKDITLINGQNAYNVLSNLSSNTTQIIFTKKDENYQVIDNFNNSNVINYIYDLGIKETSGQAESAAKNANIATNTKISLIKYLANNKIGLIEQYIKPIDSTTIETKQIIHWDGLSKLRILKFSNAFGGYWTLIEETSWTTLKTITLNEWENIDVTIQSVETKISENANHILENEEVMAKTIEYLSDEIQKLKNRIAQLEEQN